MKKAVIFTNSVGRVHQVFVVPEESLNSSDRTLLQRGAGAEGFQIEIFDAPEFKSMREAAEFWADKIGIQFTR